jgi:CubicO group peptidase (beta-lactamase class C family)
MNGTEIDRYFRELEAVDAYSGVVLITQGAEAIFEGAYGYANREWKIPNALDIRYDTASITKLFTAVAVLQLIEQGKLGFTTRAVDYLGLEDTTISPDATVYHLLTHTSGIGDDADEEAGEDCADLWVDRPNYRVRETADFLPQFMHKPANFAPGDDCRYCNCSFVLLGLMLEKATDVAYRDYVRRHVFRPAGMAQSEFLAMDMANANAATGYEPERDASGTISGWRKHIYSYPPSAHPMPAPTSPQATWIASYAPSRRGRSSHQN